MPGSIGLWRRYWLILLTILPSVGLMAGVAAVAEPPPWSTAAGNQADGDISRQLGAGRCDPLAALGGAAVSGAIIGALVGGSIGGKMDQYDQNCIGLSLEHADDGKTIWWENSAAKVRFGVTPMRSFENSAGRFCRAYRTTAFIEGRVRNAFGTACRQADGAWEQVS